MAFKVNSCLKYNGQYFQQDDIINIETNEAKRLLDLGVISPLVHEFDSDIVDHEEIECLNNAELIQNPELDEEDYNSMSIEELENLIIERDLTPSSNLKEDLVKVLIDDDNEFNSVVAQLEILGLELPDEATKEELKDILAQNNKD